MGNGLVRGVEHSSNVLVIPNIRCDASYCFEENERLVEVCGISAINPNACRSRNHYCRVEREFKPLANYAVVYKSSGIHLHVRFFHSLGRVEDVWQAAL